MADEESQEAAGSQDRVTESAEGAEESADVTSFNREDSQGEIRFTSDRDIVFESDREQNGAGDIVFKTGGVERARINYAGTGTGWGNVLGGYVSAFNVQTQYGAKGDGTTDDTAAIQAAITAACAATRGGTVYLPAGRYKLTSPLLVTSDNIVFRGEGKPVAHDPSGGHMGPSVLVPTSAAAFSGSAVIVVQQSGTPTRSLQGITLCDFGIYGGSLPAGVHGIMAQITRSVISRVKIENVPGYSIYADGHATDGCFNDFGPAIEIQNPGTGGFSFTVDAPDQRIYDNTVYGSSGTCINSAAAGLSIIGNFFLSSQGIAISSYMYDTKVISNRIEDCNGGIYLTDSASGNGRGGFLIVGNKVWNCSITTDNTTDSVNIAATNNTARGGVIIGNVFYTNSGAINGGAAGAKNRSRYHVNITNSNSTGLVVGPNSYYGYDNAATSFGTAAVSNTGTGTLFAPVAATGALPTSDPHIVGQLWSNAGTITVSAG